MSNSVIKLDARGANGEEIVIAVDFNNRAASVIIIDPRNGNMRVTDVQSIAQRGV